MNQAEAITEPRCAVTSNSGLQSCKKQIPLAPKPPARSAVFHRSSPARSATTLITPQPLPRTLSHSGSGFTVDGHRISSTRTTRLLKSLLVQPWTQCITGDTVAPAERVARSSQKVSPRPGSPLPAAPPCSQQCSCMQAPVQSGASSEVGSSPLARVENKAPLGLHAGFFGQS